MRTLWKWAHLLVTKCQRCISSQLEVSLTEQTAVFRVHSLINQTKCGRIQLGPWLPAHYMLNEVKAYLQADHKLRDCVYETCPFAVLSVRTTVAK